MKAVAKVQVLGALPREKSMVWSWNQGRQGAAWLSQARW